MKKKLPKKSIMSSEEFKAKGESFSDNLMFCESTSSTREWSVS